MTPPCVAARRSCLLADSHGVCCPPAGTGAARVCRPRSPRPPALLVQLLPRQLDIFLNFITGVMMHNPETNLYETSYDLRTVAAKYARYVVRRCVAPPGTHTWSAGCATSQLSRTCLCVLLRFEPV